MKTITLPNVTSISLSPEGGDKTINKLSELIKLRSQNEIKLHVKGVEKRGTRIEQGNRGYTLAGFGHVQSESNAEIRIVENVDFADMVYRMELSNDEYMDILERNNDPSIRKS